MCVVEDVRQVIQDFLASEQRALTARIDARGKRIWNRIDDRLRFRKGIASAVPQPLFLCLTSFGTASQAAEQFSR